MDRTDDSQFPPADPETRDTASFEEAPDDVRERLDALLLKARQLQKTPGVYLMKDAAGVVIYVGKANLLPNRVSSYFQRSADLGPKKQPMLELIHDFDVVPCESEWEALLTENRLVKDIHPRFNVRLTDGKSFPYLAITVRDEFPGVFITRDLKDPRYRGARIFGPFTSPTALRESLHLMQKIFKFRTCTLQIHEPDDWESDRDDPRRHFRPCLLYPIKQCSAPCGARISRENYRHDIDRLIRFMESKRSHLIREMTREMEAASTELAFERAAVLRDQIRAIQKLDDRGEREAGWQPEIENFYLDPQKGLESLRRTLGLDAPIRCIECIDIAHLQGGETVGSKVCFVDGRPLKNEYRRYRIKTADNDDYRSIREVVSRRYREAGDGHELYPDVILIDGGKGQLNAALEVFQELNVRPPMVISLAKKEELIFVQHRQEPICLGRTHAGLRLCQAIRDEAHRFAQHYHHVLRRKKMLGENVSTRRKA